MGIPASLLVQRSVERPEERFCPGRPVHSVPGGLGFLPCSLCPDLAGLASPLRKALQEMDKKNRRTNSGPKKPVGFFTATDGQPLDVENHRRPHSRFGGFQRALPLVTLCPTFLVSQKGGPSETRPPLRSGRIPQRSKNDQKSILSHRGCGSRPLPGRYIPPPSFLSNFLFLFFFSFLLGLRMYHIPLTYAGHMLDICMTYALPMSCTRVILPDF